MMTVGPITMTLHVCRDCGERFDPATLHRCPRSPRALRRRANIAVVVAVIATLLSVLTVATRGCG